MVTCRLCACAGGGRWSTWAKHSRRFRQSMERIGLVCVYVFASEKRLRSNIPPRTPSPHPALLPARTRSVASENRERKCLKQYKSVHLRLKYFTRAATLAASSCFMNYHTDSLRLYTKHFHSLPSAAAYLTYF